MSDLAVRGLIVLVIAGWMTHMGLPPHAGGDFLANALLIGGGWFALHLMYGGRTHKEDL